MDKAGCRTIFVGAGANVAHPNYGSPRETLVAALLELGGRTIVVDRGLVPARTARGGRPAGAPGEHRRAAGAARVVAGIGGALTRLSAQERAGAVKRSGR